MKPREQKNTKTQYLLLNEMFISSFAYVNSRISKTIQTSALQKSQTPMPFKY